MSTQEVESNIETTKAEFKEGSIVPGNRRDVRTLLLCKVNMHYARTRVDKNESKPEEHGNLDDDHGKVYKDCYNGIHSGHVNSQCRQYVTYGNFDAVSVYKTAETEDEAWLQGIRNDNWEITAKLSNERCYLPIHLITFQEGTTEFWNRAEQYPVCLTSLVYGVQRREGDKYSLDDLLTERIDQIYKLFKQKGSKKESKVDFFVYQAINICDAVVFWMTNDITTVLELSAQLGRMGHARKTFSLMGFDRKLMIQDVGQTAFQSLYASLRDEGEEYQVRIQGSIREHERAKTYFLADQESNLRKWISEYQSPLQAPVVSAVCVFGNNDFTVDIQRIGLKQLLNLAFKMLENSLDISLACWEIHTEFTLPSDYPVASVSVQSTSHPILDVLNQYLKDYHDYFSSNTDRYPWVPSYLELLVTHVNIDHDPILHAPASLFLGLARIANAYFDRAVQKTGYTELYRQLLENSNIAIQRTIRHWSQLTDQLTQADDLVFHGIGNDPAIYETLPESLLEFYHGYLRKVVNSIVKLGDNHEQSWTNWDYDFDFLLVPDQNQNPRISKMFNVTALHEVLLKNACAMRICEVCKERGNCKRSASWPEKQVYLVEFQSDLLYDPASFLFPILHECFHNFGDRYRMRSNRTESLVAIICSEIMRQLGLDGVVYREMSGYIISKLMLAQTEGLNLSRTLDALYHNWKKLILGENNGTAEAQYNAMKQNLADPFYLESADVFGKWVKIGDDFQGFQPTVWENTLRKWAYYFRECYADLMALLWLNLPLSSYLRLLDQDWKINKRNSSDKSGDAWRYIQRTALVIGAYLLHWKGNKGYTQRELDDIWEEHQIETSFDKMEVSGFISNFRAPIKETICRLYIDNYLDNHSPSDNSTHIPDYRDSLECLTYIRKYLHSVKSTFKKQINEDAFARGIIKSVRDDYSRYFKNGEQFTEEFNAILSEWNDAAMYVNSKQRGES